jgi:SAM-dependent methyltransferase
VTARIGFSPYRVTTARIGSSSPVVHRRKDRPVPLPAPAIETALLESLVGERTVPRLWHENYWFRRHEIAYLALAPRVAGPEVVLEAGSGEGYGVRVLRAAGAERVVALDYDAASLAHSGAGYPHDVGGRAVRTNLIALPLADASAAAVVCLQVIEHLWAPERFLAECARVLRPGGLLVVSTPDRITFSPGLGRRQKPPNPFHHREFDAAELRDLIAEQLEVTELLGVRHGPRLQAWQAEHGHDPVAAQLATSPNHWPAHVRDLVGSVTASDFVLGPLLVDDDPHHQRDDVPTVDDDPHHQGDDVLDLVVLARRAAS